MASSSWENFLEDPGGYLSGQNKEGFHGIGQFIRGDPDKQKAAYDQAMTMAQNYGNQSRDFLMGQQQKALAYYKPLQQLFNTSYGTGGIEAPQVPKANANLSTMFGGG